MGRVLNLLVLAATLLVSTPASASARTFDWHLEPTPWMDAWGCHGVQLWNGSQLLKTIGPSEPADGLRPCAGVSYQVDIGPEHNQRFIFAWGGGSYGAALVFGSTGMPEGTKLLWRRTDFSIGALGPGPYFDLIYCPRCRPSVYVVAMQFLATVGYRSGIITTRGTPESTRALGGSNPGAGWKADGQSLPLYVPVGDHWAGGPQGVVYVAYDQVHGRELWFSDGTQSGSHMIMDINPGGESSQIQELEETGVDGCGCTSWVRFTAVDGHGRAKWVSHGTPQTTYKLH